MKTKIPGTPAVRQFRKHNIPFTLHGYDYVDHGGTAVAAQALGVSEHLIIKTLVMEDETQRPCIVLMHGDKTVSTKALARQVGVKSISPCDPKTAQRHTGYLVGGTSPFGTRKHLIVYAESTIFQLPELFINAGKRGMLAKIASKDLVRVLKPIPVSAAI